MDKVIKFKSLIELCLYIKLHGLTVTGGVIVAKREEREAKDTESLKEKEMKE